MTGFIISDVTYWMVYTELTGILLWWIIYISILYRVIGKRKATVQPVKSSRRKPKKEKKAKKDPNKPKRPPSAFFVFLFVSLSNLFLWNFFDYANLRIHLKLTMLLWYSEEFRQEFKRDNPNVKAVSAVSIHAYFLFWKRKSLLIYGIIDTWYSASEGWKSCRR